MTSIGDNAFSRCTSLTSFTIPNSVTSISDDTFYGCSGLTSIIIPNSVTSIGSAAFGGCSGLTSISIPNSVTSIGDYAFYNCSSLTSVFCYANNVPSTNAVTFLYSPISSATLYVPAGSLEAYRVTEPWSNFGSIVALPSPTYTLTYMVDGETYKTVQYEVGESITPEEAPTKEGHTFSGWSEIPATMPAHDVVVTGTFSINSYFLIYVLDGSIYKAYNLMYGTEIVPETVQDKEGYVFSGWSEIPARMPAHDVEVQGNLYRYSDVNGDGEVDLSDAIMVTYYSLHQIPAKFNEAVADMNGDGEIDLSDAIIIIYKSLGVK